MKSTKLINFIVALFAALPLPVQLAAQRKADVNHSHPHYKVIEMGTFGGPNSYFFSEPVVESVNNQGTVVGGTDTGLPDPYAPNCFVVPDCHIVYAFKWKNGFLTDLGALPQGYSSTAYWINESGLIMGNSQNGFIDPISGLPEQVAVLWQEGGGIIDLGTLSGSFSFPNAMNNRGQVIGLAQNTVPDPYSFLNLGTETHGFVWQDGYMEDLGTLGGPDSWAAAINESSEIAGWAYINSTPNADNGVCTANVPTQDPFLWRNGEMIDLGTFGGTCGVVGSFANAGSGGAINSQGQIVGTSNLAGNQAHHAFLWNEGALTDLGTLGGANSEAYWINDAGEIVGRADVPGTQQNHHAFLWKHGKMRDLGKAKGWPCSTAIDINSQGQVIIDTGICGEGGGPGLLWENGVTYDLNTLIPPHSGFYIGNVNYINDRGDIAVTGILSNGDQRDLLLIPVGDGDDSTNNGPVTTEESPIPIARLPRSVSRYGQFSRRTSVPKQ